MQKYNKFSALLLIAIPRQCPCLCKNKTWRGFATSAMFISSAKSPMYLYKLFT